MKSFYIWIITISMALVLSGCFEILEEVNLNIDGSGSVSYTMNMSQSKVKINQVMKLDTINGYKVPTKVEIKDSISAYFAKAQQIEGIKNLKKTENFDDMIFGFSCDFENLEALNKLAKSMNKGNPNDPNINKDHYSYDKVSYLYARSGDYKIKKEFDKMRKVDQAVFENAKFISIFRSDNEIIKTSNPSAILSPSKKAVMLKLSILDILKENNNLTNSITIKPET